MLVVRGANIFPSAIETALRSVGGFGPEFEIRVSKRGALDEILVRAEYDPEAPAVAGSRDELKSQGEVMLKRMTGIQVPIEVIEPGSLPAPVFKARRVVAARPRPCPPLRKKSLHVHTLANDTPEKTPVGKE